jgi:hypothetical protein
LRASAWWRAKASRSIGLTRNARSAQSMERCERVVHRGVIQTSYFRLVITTWVAFAVETRSVQ